VQGSGSQIYSREVLTLPTIHLYDGSRGKFSKDYGKDYGNNGISRDEFMGVMAEAEFYTLFTETFQELDKDSTGYVRAGDLDEVLGGVRDLISDEQTGSNIIDVEDKDLLVDYEQFSKMLHGAAL
jgi:calmodulin